MSFATLRQLRYLVLILTKTDMAVSESYVIGNVTNTSKTLPTNSG